MKRYIFLGIITLIFFWIIETALEVFVFQIESRSFIQLLFYPNYHEIWTRLVMILLVFILIEFIFKYSELRKLKIKLEGLSITDELTGLYNRRGFFVLAEQQLKLVHRENKRMLVCSVDLDHLKIINDKLGHFTGDLALIETANILKETFRKSDIVSRIGGDEFVILAKEDTDTNIETIRERMQKNIDAHNKIQNRGYEIQLSTGIVLYNPEQPGNIEELISKSDKLMYEEKMKKPAP
jgi:diguanylate cyclase (GGDEF)-like protein